jgi:hypothetical protein
MVGLVARRDRSLTIYKGPSGYVATTISAAPCRGQADRDCVRYAMEIRSAMTMTSMTTSNL